MRLADHILAARGSSIYDLYGLATSLAAGIEEAQRFTIDNDVARAAVGVLRSRPSSLISALPLCRLPFPKVWLEWSPDAQTGRGQGRDNVTAPTPWRMGVLIEASDASLQCGSMTWAWMHIDTGPTDGLNVCPLSVVFDWRPDINLPAVMAASLHKSLSEQLAHIVSDTATSKYTMDDARRDMRALALQRGWDKHADDTREVAAVCELVRRTTPWVSHHAARFMLQTVNRPNFEKMMSIWQADLQGEEPYAAALITMMNSRNCVTHDAADLTKLNRSRRKSGKPEFLSYTTTRLRIAQHLRRAVIEGRMTHDEAREHDVRGHFKLRSTGVFWWSPFRRGDPTRLMPRREYEVTE